MNKSWLTFVATALLAVALGATLWFRNEAPSRQAAADERKEGDGCAKHSIESCPFCDPTLIEKLGWCGGHGVPEAVCTRCNAVLIEAFQAEGDWCGKHELPESQCEFCHPEVKEKWVAERKRISAVEAEAQHTDKQDADRLWCRAHGVYEDECVICHPEIAKKQSAIQLGELGNDRGLWCNEHDVAERECGICQPQLAPQLLPGKGLMVRLPSLQSASKAGVRTGAPRLAKTDASFGVYCEVRYDQNRLARITPLASGVIHSVHVDVGDKVSKGDLLVEIASAEVATAKRDLLVAIIDERLKKLAYDREMDLARKEISAAQHFQQAEAEYEMAGIRMLSARQRLLNYGATEAEVTEVEKTKSSSSIVHIHAPFDGTLVERAAVVGEAVAPGTAIFSLADLSTMWLRLSIPEGKLAYLKSGLRVEATFAALPGLTARGKVAWINAAVSEPSRMLEARAVVTNPDGKLRSNMFGEARIFLGGGGQALTISASAVQRFERRPFVFVKREEDLYELRRVEIGGLERNRVQIVRGLSAEDRVVVVGSYTMMSEFLKSRLGAGCVHD